MRHTAITLAIASICTPAGAWEPAQQPPAMPMEYFKLPEGLEIKPWAASPALFNPTNLDVDHLGRIWVTEGVNYRGKADRRPAGDRIVILEDSDGDGTCDRSSVFWQSPELLSPLGIAVFDNVVIVSQPPHLLKLTDVNRDLKFDPASGDKREELLTGFNGRNHDHSLHSVTAGPDGKWYFNQGNTGAIFTDKSGKTFRLGSAYYKSGGGEWPQDTNAAAGKASDDGFVYVGGSTVRMNPDATNAEIIGYNYRNSYEQTITSQGFVFQNDNDDPPACRTSQVQEYGSAGYFSPDGRRFWDADRRPGQEIPTAEWRQEDPGSMPSGDVYGGGSPTGIAFYENGALGDKFNGTLLSCEAARNVIFGYQPARDGAGFKLDRTDFVTTNPEKNFDGADFTGGVKKQGSTDDKIKFSFRPSDVCVGADGALYIADWTDPRVGGHDTQDNEASGVIYRIAPKDFKPTVPKIDPNTLEGSIAALQSPAVNVRYLGFRNLKAAGEKAYPAVAKVLENTNPYVAARAIYLLPYLGAPGKAKLDEIIASSDAARRLTAFRAVRRTDGKIDDLPYAKKLAGDADPTIRAEAALAMRSRNFAQAEEVLVKVAQGYDGKDRAYLNALGTGAGHSGEALWKSIGRALKMGDAASWPDSFARITWRLMAPAAVASLKTRTAAATLGEEQRKLAVDSIAFINSKEAPAALMDLATTVPAVKVQALWWLNSRAENEWKEFGVKAEMEKRGLVEKLVPLVEITVPLKPESTKFKVEDVLALKGDAARGKAAAGRCIMCHKINGAGPDHGPDLKGFASRQPPEIVARSIVDPSFDISHGFEGTALQLKDGKWIDGHIISDADPVITRSTGGMIQKVPRDFIVHRHDMDRSLMLNADQLGMTAQDVADVVEWLKSY